MANANPSRKEKARTAETTGQPLKDLVTVFKALADKTRLRILKLLKHGEFCVCDMVVAMDSTQSKVSFHLNTLKQAGLVKDKKDGKWMHYAIDESDLFKRFLILYIMEKISPDMPEEDTKRLEKFLGNKAQTMPLFVCCAKNSKQ